MHVTSSFVHLVVQNTMMKMDFKMDIILVRLIILKSLYYRRLCGRCSDDLTFGG
jgi:hypothetical protein